MIITSILFIFLLKMVRYDESCFVHDLKFLQKKLWDLTIQKSVPDTEQMYFFSNRLFIVHVSNLKPGGQIWPPTSLYVALQSLFRPLESLTLTALLYWILTKMRFMCLWREIPSGHCCVFFLLETYRNVSQELFTQDIIRGCLVCLSAVTFVHTLSTICVHDLIKYGDDHILQLSKDFCFFFYGKYSQPNLTLFVLNTL